MTGELASEGWQPRLCRGAVVRHDPARDVELLLLPERVVKLNESAAAILRLCDGERTVARITSEMVSCYSDQTIASDVHGFIEAVSAEGWLR